MSVYNIVPKFGYLLVEPLPLEETTSKIALPEEDEIIHTNKGRVIQIAKQGRKIPAPIVISNSNGSGVPLYEVLEYRPDSVIWFKDRNPQKVKIDNKQYYLIDQHDVIAEWED